MVIYVSGGSGSGKSAYAESLIAQSQYSRRTYIATMRVWDAEGQQRVERHRAMRLDKGFETLECPVSLEKADIPPGAVLLEDLTNLFMNEYFEGSRDSARSRVEQALRRLSDGCGLLVIVGNDLSAGAENLDAEMRAFTEELGRLNAFAAALADECYEVAAGLPLLRRPEEAAPARGLTLIIGGACQGKRDYAARHFDRGRGLTDRFDEADRADVFCGLENWLRCTQEPMTELEALLSRNPDLTIICDEVGCGIVPTDETERAWRERVGRVCCTLAGRADRVLRIWCGIPTLLKGEKL